MRRFAIESALLPLLRAMHAEDSGNGFVISLRLQKWWAADLRKHLGTAGITRAALFHTDATRKRLRFHDLRSTGLTWMAIRGDDPLKIQQRAGHTSFEMTQKYIRTAEAVGEAIGEPFPALPECLLAGANRPADRPGELQLSESIVEAPGIEPVRAPRRNPLRNATLTDISSESQTTIPIASTLSRLVPLFGAESRQPDGNGIFKEGGRSRAAGAKPAPAARRLRWLALLQFRRLNWPFGETGPRFCCVWATLVGMERGVVVRGKLHGRHIELDERVDELDGEVEVFVRSVGATPRPPDVLEVIASMPAGTRSKADIDRRLADDRAGWTDRG